MRTNGATKKMSTTSSHNPIWSMSLLASGALSAALSLLVVAGCANNNGASDMDVNKDSLLEHPALQGIPIPTGYQLVPERSVFWAGRGLRVAKCEFTGGRTPVQVLRFYRENMPKAGFAAREERMDEGDYALRFESDSEEALVRVMPKWDSTVIRVEMRPRGEESGPSAAQPKRNPPPAEGKPAEKSTPKK